MKSLTLVTAATVLLVTAFPVFALDHCDKTKEVLTCEETISRQKLSVAFETVDEKTTVLLKELTYSEDGLVQSSKILNELPCFRQGSMTSPDLPQLVLECYDPTKVDLGHRISLSTPDFTGVRWTTVTELNFVGPTVLAKLPCQKK